MKRAFVLALVLMLMGVGVWWWYRRTSPNPPAKRENQAVSPTPTLLQQSGTPVVSNGTTYRYSLFAADPGTLTLVANPGGDNSFSQLIQTNRCTAGINAGFYDTDGNPLGLFRTADATVHEAITSALLDGYVWVAADGRAGIGTELPADTGIALQNGPILLHGGAVRPLRITADEPARRAFAALDTAGKLWFGIIHGESNTFGGPLLADLPLALEDIAAQERLTWTDAINLDGGSASAFTSGELTLAELTPVGGIFCRRSADR